MTKVIGFVGSIGSGKDTAADYLCNFHEFKRDSFAATLKDAVAKVFGWDREMLEGRTKQSREWREQVDEWWAARLNLPRLTPRWVLQQWGTEVCRLGFHDDIWIASLENKIRKSSDDIVLSDARFPNEIAAIKNLGGKVYMISRGDDPAWFPTAKQHYLRPDLKLMQKLYPSVHASEYSWVGANFDGIISNDGTIQQLYDSIEKTLVATS